MRVTARWQGTSCLHLCAAILTLAVFFSQSTEAAVRGGSGWLDSLGHSLSGAWRVADYAAVSRVVRLS
ncbi:MAG: hypothetical protein GDA66_19005 [Nitrospira sp. CR1.2]|nr:hypothetical protein [Nitrospira sp. CR1.2]